MNNSDNMFKLRLKKPYIPRPEVRGSTAYMVKLKLTAHLITKILSLNVTNSKYYGSGYTLFFNNKSLELNRKIGCLVQRR